MRRIHQLLCLYTAELHAHVVKLVGLLLRLQWWCRWLCGIRRDEILHTEQARHLC